jgi:hypothetical protein
VGRAAAKGGGWWEETAVAAGEGIGASVWVAAAAREKHCLGGRVAAGEGMRAAVRMTKAARENSGLWGKVRAQGGEVPARAVLGARARASGRAGARMVGWEARGGVPGRTGEGGGEELTTWVVRGGWFANQMEIALAAVATG